MPEQNNYVENLLKVPFTGFMIDEYTLLSRINLAKIERHVGNYLQSIVPLYKGIDDDLETVGSGILLNVDEAFYLVTAAHVFFAASIDGLYLLGSQPYILNGTWTHTVRPPLRIDERDWAYIQLTDDVIEDFGIKNFISGAQEYYLRGRLPGSLLGYPLSKNKMSRQKFLSPEKKLLVDTVGYGFQHMVEGAGIHLTTKFTRKGIMNRRNGCVETFPEPHGLSGGAILLANDLVKPTHLLLGGIITEWDRKVGTIRGVQIADVIRDIRNRNRH